MLDHAGHAPGGEEVDQHRAAAAAQVGRRERGQVGAFQRRQGEIRGRLADEGGGYALRVVAAGPEPAQHGVEPGPDGGRGAERRQQQQAAARWPRRGADLAHARAPALTAFAEGAETRIRRSLSDSPPPSAMSAPPSQIQGASGLWCSRMHRAAVALLAQHGIEVGDPGGVDRRLAGGHAVDREAALVRLQHGDQAVAVADFRASRGGRSSSAPPRCGCRSAGIRARRASSPRPASAARARSVASPMPARPRIITPSPPCASAPPQAARGRPRARDQAACGRLNSAMRSTTSASARGDDPERRGEAERRADPVAFQRQAEQEPAEAGQRRPPQPLQRRERAAPASRAASARRPWRRSAGRPAAGSRC